MSIELPPMSTYGGNPARAGASPGLVKGTAWSAIQIVTSQFLTAAIFFVLARIIAPKDFGVVAIAQSILIVLQAIAGFGIQQFYIQEQMPSERKQSTVFFLIMALSLFIALLYIGFVTLYPSPRELRRVQIMLTLSVPLSAAYAIHQAVITKKFGFRSLALRSVVAQSLGGAAGVSLALVGFGPWAIVVYRLTVVIGEAVTIWLQYRWLPAIEFDFRYAVRASAGGARILGVQLISMAEPRSMEIMAAAFTGLQGLALLSMTTRIIDLVTQVSIKPFHSTTLPHISAIRDDTQAVARYYLATCQWIAWISFPAYGFIALRGPAIVSLLLGAKWDEVGHYLPILAINGIVYSIMYLYEPTLIGLGRFNDILASRVIQAAAVISFAATGFAKHSLLLGVIGQVAGLAVSAIAISQILRIRVGIKLFLLVRGFLKPLICTAVPMVICMLVIPKYWHPAFSIFLAGVIFILVYPALTFVVDRNRFMAAKNFIVLAILRLRGSA